MDKGREAELIRLHRQELQLIRKRREKQDSRLAQLLEDKVPDRLRTTLDKAFARAFRLVLEKGSGLIEKTYDRQGAQARFLQQEEVIARQGRRRDLRVHSRRALGAGLKNLTLSGGAGIGLGILGIGLPDIVLFTGLMLKNIYEIALRYGFDYQSEEEQGFILRIIHGAVSYGDAFLDTDNALNHFIETGAFPSDLRRDDLIRQAAGGLSRELLYLKFLQGIPVIGAVGGAYDAVYMGRVTEYAELKYRRRYYLGRR